MEVIDAIETRTSIRKFGDDPVEDEDLKTMLRAATRAPNPGNRQQWHFIVVKNKDVLRQMREAVESETWKLIEAAKERHMMEEAKEVRSRLSVFLFFEDAPLTIAVCERIDPPDGRARIWQAMGLSPSEIDRLRPARVLQGIGAAIENLTLAAISLGYGTCWMTGPLIAVHQLEEILEVKPPHRLIALIPVGRPAQHPALRPRKSVEEVMSVIA